MLCRRRTQTIEVRPYGHAGTAGDSSLLMKLLAIIGEQKSQSSDAIVDCKMDYSSLAEQALEASKAFEAATTFQASTTLDVPNAINASKAFDASNTFDPSGIPQLLSSQEEDVATPTDKLSKLSSISSMKMQVL